MQTVILEGEFGNRFGKRWNTNCNTLLDIFKLIECQREGFKQYIMECHDAGTQFDIRRGDDYLEDEREVLLKLNDDDVVITPIPAGSKGAGKLLAAIVIIWAGYWIVQGAAVAGGGLGAASAYPGTAAGKFMANVGFKRGSTWGARVGYGLMLSGASLGLRSINEMLAPNPSNDDEEDVSLLGGTVNTTQQGVPVPIAYGELIVGGATISAGYSNYYGSFEVGTWRLPGQATSSNLVIPPGSVLNVPGSGDESVVDETTSSEQDEL